MNFEFATSGEILFGRGVLEEGIRRACAMGKRPLIVTGKSHLRAAPLLEILNKAAVPVRIFSVVGEPTTDDIRTAIGFARTANCDMVMAIGGGSVIDSGKAIAALLTNKGDLFDYLEVIGKGAPLLADPAPCVAIPTTAGTGAEVTRNAVLGSVQHAVKVSMRSAKMLPDLAIVDPALTDSMPPSVTAATGLDALTQLIECFVGNKANPLTDGICREGMGRAAKSLRRVFEDGSDTLARDDMALASLFGGLALANSKLGAVHGFAGPLGGMLPIPHGIICACLLPHVMVANVQALSERMPDSFALARFDEVARILTGDMGAKAADGVAWIEDLCQALEVESLSNYGLHEDHFEQAADKASCASSMKGNPIELSREELIGILEKAI